MKHLSIAVAALCVSSFVSVTSAAKYPVILYSPSDANSSPVEERSTVAFSDVVNKYHD